MAFIAKTESGVNLWFGICCSNNGQIIYSPYEPAPYTGTAVPLAKSIDGGDTWSDIYADLKLVLGEATWMSTCSGDGSAVIFTGSTGPFVLSTDGGITFDLVDTPAPSVTRPAINNDGSLILYASGTDLVASTNGGSSWSTMFTVPIGDGQDISSITMSDDGTKILVVTWFTKVYLSTNGGSSFAEIFSDVAIFGSTCAISNDAQYIYLAESTDIHTSINSGTSFTTSSSALSGTVLNISCSSDGRVAAANTYTQNPLALSVDYGTTWTPENGSLVHSGVIVARTSPIVWTSIEGFYDGDYQPNYLFYNLVSNFSITSIAPSTGSTAGGTPVTIVGTGFDPSATAAIDGNDLTDVTVVDSTTITGITPAGTAGVVDVTVTNP